MPCRWFGRCGLGGGYDSGESEQCAIRTAEGSLPTVPASLAELRYLSRSCQSASGHFVTGQQVLEVAVWGGGSNEGAGWDHSLKTVFGRPRAWSICRSKSLKPSGDLERTPEAVLAVVICLCEVAALPTPLVPWPAMTRWGTRDCRARSVWIAGVARATSASAISVRIAQSEAAIQPSR